MKSIRHAKVQDLFHVEYGYDAGHRRTYTRDLLETTQSELYQYDNLNRLVDFKRGTLNTEGTEIVSFTPIEFLIQPYFPVQGINPAQAHTPSAENGRLPHGRSEFILTGQE